MNADSSVASEASPFTLNVDVRGRFGDREIAVAFVASAAGGPTVVVGPNGAGKTSALMMVLGASRPDTGRVALGEAVLFDSAHGVNTPLERRRIGYLPQRYALFPHLTVLENVAYGILGKPREQRSEEARSILRALEADQLAERRIAALSGGEAQRVALGRALASRPRALLLDEPLAALDAGLRADVRRSLAETLRTLAIPTVVVTHDRSDVEALGGDVVVLESGRVVQRGTLGMLAAAPATSFVRSFVTPPR